MNNFIIESFSFKLISVDKKFIKILSKIMNTCEK